jgi:hypothetical protein
MLCGLYLAPNHHYLKGTQQWIDKLLKYETTMCKFQIFVYPAIYIDMIHFSLLNKNNPLSSKTVNWRYQGGVKHQEAFSGAHVISFDYTGFLMVFKHLGNTIQTLLCCSYPW